MKQAGRRAPEIEHSLEGYKNPYEEFFGEITDAILKYLDKRSSEFSKQALLQMVKIFHTASWTSTFRGT